MPWLQLFIDASRDDVTTIEQTLLTAGAVSVTLQDNADQPILEPALGETPLWNETRVTGLFEAHISTGTVNQIISRNLNLTASQFRWEQLEDKDWEREWMKNYHPIQCGEKLWICPSWESPPDPTATNILLDPGLAFGTGTHPTTFLCLQWLAEQNLTDKNLVDYGCGSGILGIAALLLGARQVTGTDIDQQALLATHENLQRNGLCENQFPVHLPNRLPEIEVDIVIANILAGPLAELSSSLTRLVRPGGKLCLSGILSAQAGDVIEAYIQDFDFDPIVEHNEWVRLTATKKV